MDDNEAAKALSTFDFQTLEGQVVKASFTAREETDLSRRNSLVTHACLRGDVDVFDAVLRAMEERRTNEEVDG